MHAYTMISALKKFNSVHWPLWYMVYGNRWYMVYGNRWYMIYGNRWYMVYGNRWYMVYGNRWYMVYGNRCATTEKCLVRRWGRSEASWSATLLTAPPSQVSCTSAPECTRAASSGYSSSSSSRYSPASRLPTFFLGTTRDRGPGDLESVGATCCGNRESVIPPCTWHRLTLLLFSPMICVNGRHPPIP